LSFELALGAVAISWVVFWAANSCGVRYPNALWGLL